MKEGEINLQRTAEAGGLVGGRPPAFEEITPGYALRPYQRDAVAAICTELRSHGRVLLHAPTGSGKTRMAMSVVTMHLRERGPTMVLWLAPSSELIDQAASAFGDAWRSHGDVRAAVIQWWGQGEAFSHSMALRRNTVLIAGLQMAVQSTRALPESLRLLREKATLIVFDEAHQSVAPTYRSLVGKVIDTQGQTKHLLGLSATPGRADETQTIALAEFYGGRKVGVGPGGNPVRFLVAEGYLAEANVRVRTHPGTPPPAPQPVYDDYTEAQMAGLGAIRGRNEAIVGLVRDLVRQRHKRIIAFTPSVSSAMWCAQTLKDDGMRYATAVYGAMPQNHRDHVLNTYRMSAKDNPHPQVIFNCRALTAGVDLPQTSAVVVGKPTRSHILLQQMIGRALRGPKSGGNAIADIWILADDSYEDFGDLAAMFTEWDDLWEPNDG